MLPWCGNRGERALEIEQNRVRWGLESHHGCEMKASIKKSDSTALVLCAIIAFLLSQHRFNFRKSKF